MHELLELCGFNAKDFDVELPRVEKAFQKLGISAADIARGKQRLNKYYDIELEGVRKSLRLCLLDLVNSVLAREEGKEHIISGFMSREITDIGSALVSISPKTYATNYSWVFHLIMGCIFDKMVPVLEAAEKKWLKAGAVTHCANVKTIVGLLALDMIPKPDLMVTSGFMCETAPKTLDLLHELYDLPVLCYDTCQDREFREYSAATERTINMAAKSLRMLIARVQEVAGFAITDNLLREVLDARSRWHDAFSRLRDIIENSDPLPINATHENIWLCLNSLTLSIDGINDAIAAVNTLCEELQERVNKGVGAVEKGAPRILSILPTHHSDPRLDYLIGELGMAMICAETGFSLPYEDATKDPYVEMSLLLQTSMCTSLPKRIPLIIEGCKRLKVDGVLDRFHAGCRTTAGDALIMKNAVEKELNIPVLLLEWDSFDPRVYQHEPYRRRLELFKSMLAKGSA